MHRRKLLRAATGLGTVGLAGCSFGGDEDGAPAKSSPTRTGTAPSGGEEPSSTDADEGRLELPWRQLPGPYGGPVTDVAVSPADPSYIYASSKTAGLYASTDGGQTWTQGPESKHHKSRVWADPHAASVARSKNSRTEDGGRTWFDAEHRPDRLREPPVDSIDVGDFAYDPFREDTLYAGTPEGVYRTIDGGRSWSRTRFDTPSQDVSWIEASAGREGVVYGAFYDHPTVVRSRDHGENWTEVVDADQLDGGPVRGLAVNGSEPGGYLAVDGEGIYRFGTDADGWIGPDVQSPYFLYYDGPALSADEARLYYHAYSLEETDSGRIWRDMQLYQYDATTGTTRALEMPERPASVSTHPIDPETVYFGGWSWIWRSRDRGASWTPLRAAFTDRYLSAVGTNPDRPGTVVPGSICSSGLWVSHDGGGSFTWKRSGLDPFHEGEFNEHYVNRIAGGGDALYATTQSGLLVSADNGRSWALRENRLSGQGDQRRGEALMVLDGVAVHPEDPATVYVGTGITGPDDAALSHFDRTLVGKSTDGGATFTETTNGFPSETKTAVQALLIRQRDPAELFVGTGAVEGAGVDLGLFRSNDAGESWDAVSTPFARVHDMTEVADPEESVVAATPAGVYRSRDGGTQWTQVLPYHAKAVLGHPSLGAGIVVSAQKYDDYWDVFVSTDAGETWREGNLTIQAGPGSEQRPADGRDGNAHYREPKGQIRDLAIDPEREWLYAATRGAGLWSGDLGDVSGEF